MFNNKFNGSHEPLKRPLLRWRIEFDFCSPLLLRNWNDSEKFIRWKFSRSAKICFLARNAIKNVAPVFDIYASHFSKTQKVGKVHNRGFFCWYRYEQNVFLCLRFDEFLLGKKSREMREAGNCDKDKVLSHYFLETRRSKHIFKRGIIKQKADLVAQMRIVSPHFALNNSQESNKIMIMNLSFSFRINWTEEENNFETIKLKKKSNKCSID